MDLNVLLWILAGGFTGTWGLCIYFMNRTDTYVSEIRKEIMSLHDCVKDHHGRLCVIEDREKNK